MSLDRTEALLDVAIDAALDGDFPAYLRVQQRILAEAGGESGMHATLSYLVASDPDGYVKLARMAEKTRYLRAVGEGLQQQVLRTGSLNPMTVCGHA